MEKLFQVHNNLLKQLGTIFVRNVFSTLENESRITGIVGARGVGKTTYLLHYIKKNYSDRRGKALYVSADHFIFSEKKLYDVAQEFIEKYAGELFCVDEIHKYKNWQQELKNIYDSFPQVKIIFSGSSTLEILKGKYDLSRRVVIKKLYGLSFREYLEFHYSLKHPAIDFDDIVNRSYEITQGIANIPALLGKFNDYLMQGYYPFSLELAQKETYFNALYNVVEKVIYQDIPATYPIKSKNIETFKKLLYFFATSSPGELSVNKLSVSLKKDNKTIESYINMLSDAGLFRFPLKDKNGHSLVRNANKSYISNTNLLNMIVEQLGKESPIGTVREVFFINQVQNAGLRPSYSDFTDFNIGDYFFEVGGKNKTTKQISSLKNAFIVRDDTIFVPPNMIPLYLFGFLY